MTTSMMLLVLLGVPLGAAGHQIRMMPVVFDSCFGEFPDLQRYRDKDWMACPGQNRLGPDHWPKLEQYVRDVVGGHKDDPRIVMWDVMNEPTCPSFNKPEDQRLIWAFLDHFLDDVREQQPVQPLTVGVEHSSLIPKVLAKLDVMCFHNYRRDLREDTRQVQALGRKHGRPAIINEVAGRPQQPFSYVMPILREERIGWCFWELMLGKTQFSRAAFLYQGLVYPDGTCFDAREVSCYCMDNNRISGCNCSCHMYAIRIDGLSTVLFLALLHNDRIGELDDLGDT